MWQVLLAAAAAAGSGILAKKFMNPFETEKTFSHFNQNDPESEQNNESLQPRDSVFPSDNTFEEKRDATSEDGEIFRFSSPQTGHDLKKKTGCKIRGIKKNGGSKRGRKSRVVEGGEKELERGNGTAKRISVCLKKRKTGKNVAGKCESCASKDNSFSWGVGVGIMYVMSAGKAEISRLNCTMDETSKIVQELKAEISRRKSSCNMHTSAEANKKHVEGNYTSCLVTRPGECGSRVHTEEEWPEVLEMDKLEAELESELQKIPWCGTESSGSEGREDVVEAEIVAKEHRSEDHQNSSSFQYGVLPAELDQKLCHLLIEQQEGQISELEAELNDAHSKLQQKEAELQALKNCVKHLSEFSLASASDEEIEDNEDVKTRDGIKEKLELEPTKSLVGMKRTMDYESHPCSSD